MHEMAIAEGILDIALDYAHENKAQRIDRIHLLLGELSGVETEALSLAFSSMQRGTIAENAGQPEECLLHSGGILLRIALDKKL